MSPAEADMTVPIVLETTSRWFAALPVRVPRSEIQSVMGPGIARVHTTIQQRGIAPTGPWMTHHLRITPEKFDFEICVPVAAPFEAIGDVRAVEWPAQRVAMALHRGPYEGLGPAWGEFMAWLKANGHTPAEDLWECYAVGPETSPHPSDWITELYRPLV